MFFSFTSFHLPKRLYIRYNDIQTFFILLFTNVHINWSCSAMILSGYNGLLHSINYFFHCEFQENTIQSTVLFMSHHLSNRHISANRLRQSTKHGPPYRPSCPFLDPAHQLEAMFIIHNIFYVSHKSINQRSYFINIYDSCIHHSLASYSKTYQR